MARKVGISGAGTGVKMSGADTYAKAIGDVGTGIEGLGQGIKAAEEYKFKTELNQQKIAEEQARVAAVSQQALTKSQVDLYKAEAEDRVRVFTASQKNIWNEETLKNNQLAFEEEEISRFAELKEQGAYTEDAFAEIEGLWMPQYISQARGDSSIQVNEAAVKSSIANYDNLITKATNRGDLQSADNITKTMLAQGLINGETYHQKMEENGRASDRGLIRMAIHDPTVTSEELIRLQGEVSRIDGQFKNLSLDDRANLQTEIVNQRLTLLKSQELPAEKSLRVSLNNGTLTQEQIDASKASPQFKEMYGIILRNNRDLAYRRLGEKRLGELSALLDDFMNGTNGPWGWFDRPAEKDEVDAIITWLNNNKADNLLIQDVMDIIMSGKAGDNAIAYLNLKDEKVDSTKYEKAISPYMKEWRDKFQTYTSELPAGSKLNELGKVYFNFWKDIQKADGNQSEIIDNNLSTLKSEHDAYIMRERASADAGIVSVRGQQVGVQSTVEQYASESGVSILDVTSAGLPLTAVDDVRLLVGGKQKMTLEQAIQFIKDQNK